MNKIHFDLLSQVTFNMRFVWSKRKDQKREKSPHEVQRQKGISLILSQLHFFLETQFLLYDHIILSQIIWHHDPRFICRLFGLR